MTIEIQQRQLCKKYGVDFFATHHLSKVGVALNVRDGVQPLNGLRHLPSSETSGWYIWAGETLSTEADFFKPIHAEHIVEWCFVAEKYLGLPPGWRFLVSNDYEDVWYDPSLILS